MMEHLQNREIILRIDKKLYTIERSERFRHFHKNITKPPNGFYNLSKIIEACLVQPGFYVFGYPVLVPKFESTFDLKTEKEKINKYSPAIDFLFASYKEDTQVLEIDSFDFATSMKKDKITVKLKNKKIGEVRKYL